MKAFKTILLGGLLVLTLSANNNPRITPESFFKSSIKASEERERKERIIKAISKVESEYNPLAHNKKEDARGLLQIRKIMVKEINLYTPYSLSHKDCWDSIVSIEAFTAYQDQFNPDWEPEKAAKLWNGGRSGENKPQTQQYWERVKEVLKTI